LSAADFQAILPVTLGPVAKLFALGFVGLLLRRSGVLDNRGVDTLTRLTVCVLLPMILLRLMAFPALGFLALGGLLHAGLLTRAWAFLLFLQTISPTATNIAAIARQYGSEEVSDFVNHLCLMLYLAAMATIPFWIMIWAMKFGLGIG